MEPAKLRALRVSCPTFSRASFASYPACLTCLCCIFSLLSHALVPHVPLMSQALHTLCTNLIFVLLCSHASRTLFAIQFLLAIFFCEGEICYGWKKYKYVSNNLNWRWALIKNLICLNYFEKKNPDTNPDWECFRSYLAQFVEEKNYFSVKLHLSKSCNTTKKFQLWKFLQETLYICIYICI